jgi:hypothetical protein
MGGLFLEGVQLLMDGQNRFLRSGLQCSLRVQNFASKGNFQEVGVPYTPDPSVVGADQTGFTDILIDPPPEVKDVKSDNKGLDAVRMQFGSKEFRISHTFVENMQQTYPRILDPYDVFRQWDGGVDNAAPQTASVIGIVYEDRLYSIESINRKSAGARTLTWLIQGTFHENDLPAVAAETIIP